MKRDRSLVKAAGATRSADLLEATDRVAHDAYLMRQSGKSWWDIAEALGVTEAVARTAVDRAITQAAEMVSEHAKRQLLVLEVARLDELQAAYWDDATKSKVTQTVGPDGEVVESVSPPNMRAAETVLKIIAARTKLLGLDDMSHAAVTQQTVIVAGTSEEYIAALRSVAPPRAEAG